MRALQHAMLAETVTQNEHGTIHSESSLRQNTLGDITNTTANKSPSLTKFVTKKKAHSSLDEAFRLISQKVNANNQNLLRAILKVSKRSKMTSHSRIETALHLLRAIRAFIPNPSSCYTKQERVGLMYNQRLSKEEKQENMDARLCQKQVYRTLIKRWNVS